jgi:hypothetical protein
MKTEDRIYAKERNNFMCKVKMKTILWDDENNKVEVEKMCKKWVEK